MKLSPAIQALISPPGMKMVVVITKGALVQNGGLRNARDLTLSSEDMHGVHNLRLLQCTRYICTHVLKVEVRTSRLAPHCEFGDD